ncbi:MAG: YdcF family protein [Clostridia bacterium]|nr:YdcF family protein [Clostridia bacterium]
MSNQRHGGKRILRILLALLAAGVMVYAGIVAMVYWKETHVPPAEDYGAIVVLGAQVKPDGVPSVQLQWRLDTAAALWHENPVYVVTCGAQGANEPAPEGEVMRDYLIAAGVDESMILVDAASFNTRQNIRHAAELLEGTGVTKILIVTSDYHLPRAMALAEDEGLEATGKGSPCKNDIVNWSKNHLREALSWVKYWGQKYLKLPLD